MSIVAVARSELPLTNLKIKYGEERVATVQGDLGDEAVVKQVVDTCIQRFGAIDSIIANAGVLEPVQKIELADIAQWKCLFDINFFSIVSLVAQAIPYLKRSKGNVILVSSGASTKGYVSTSFLLPMKQQY
jgi:NADP-dependent 3-hydroxy acid dehydrogenase YdfG